MNAPISPAAQGAIRAARIYHNLGSAAGRGYARKHGVLPSLYRLACQLVAAQQSQEVTK